MRVARWREGPAAAGAAGVGASESGFRGTYFSLSLSFACGGVASFWARRGESAARILWDVL
jgi:hypothetical protein